MTADAIGKNVAASYGAVASRTDRGLLYHTRLMTDCMRCRRAARSSGVPTRSQHSRGMSARSPRGSRSRMRSEAERTTKSVGRAF